MNGQVYKYFKTFCFYDAVHVDYDVVDKEAILIYERCFSISKLALLVPYGSKYHLNTNIFTLHMTLCLASISLSKIFLVA